MPLPAGAAPIALPPNGQMQPPPPLPPRMHSPHTPHTPMGGPFSFGPPPPLRPPPVGQSYDPRDRRPMEFGVREREPPPPMLMQMERAFSGSRDYDPMAYDRDRRRSPPPPMLVRPTMPLPPPAHGHLAPLPPPPVRGLPPPPLPMGPPMHGAHPPPHMMPPPPRPGMPPALPPPPPPGGHMPLPLRSLPLPPPPPLSMQTGAGSAPPDAWRVYRTAPPESLEYFFNTLTGLAQWQRPVELLPDHERPLPQCDWTEHKTEDGITYFANPKTGVSMWQRPPELTAWLEAKRLRDEAIARRRAEQGLAPLENAPSSGTDLSAIALEKKKKDLLKKTEKAQKKKAAASAASTTGGAPTTPAKAADAMSVEEEEEGALPAEGADSTAAGSGMSDDPIYASKDEARAAFRQLLIDKGITARMKNFANDVQPLIQHDPRYHSLKTVPERKKVYLSYMEELVRAEQEQRKDKESVLLAAFQELLVETVEIDSKSRFKPSVALLESDDRYRSLHTLYLIERVAAGSTNPQVNLDSVAMRLEAIFYKHVDALAQKEKLAAAARRLAQSEAFKQLLRDQTELSALEPGATETKPEEKDEGELEEGEEGALPPAVAAAVRPPAPRWINASTSFRQLKKRAEFTADPRWLDGPSESDAYDLFEGWVSKLSKIAREKEQAAREARKAEESRKRKEFRALLTEQAEKANIHGRSRWKEVLPHIQDDARYTALFDAYVQADRDHDKTVALDQMKDLLADFVAKLAERHEPTRKVLKGVLKDLKIVLLPFHTAEALTQSCSAHQQWEQLTGAIPASEVTCVWRELVSKAAAKASYFHSRQKSDQIAVVVKMLRGLYADNSSSTADASELLRDAAAITFEQCAAKVAELQQPVPASSAPAEEPEEGALEDGEMADVSASASAATALKPRSHPAYVADGLQAWQLLTQPPIPAPDADQSAPPSASTQAYTTDEYTREAVDAFKLKLKEDIERKSKAKTSSKKRADDSESDEEEGEERKSGKDSKRKRRRSASRSNSRSRSRSQTKKSSSSSSKPKRAGSNSRSRSPAAADARSNKRQRDTEPDSKPKTNGVAAAAVAASSAPTFAPMADDEAEEGEL